MQWRTWHLEDEKDIYHKMILCQFHISFSIKLLNRCPIYKNKKLINCLLYRPQFTLWCVLRRKFRKYQWLVQNAKFCGLAQSVFDSINLLHKISKAFLKDFFKIWEIRIVLLWRLTNNYVWCVALLIFNPKYRIRIE